MPRPPGQTTMRMDEGSALPMVLAFITVIGLIVGALLGQAAANFQATTALRDQRDRVYAADAGLERALRAVNVLTTPVCPAPATINGATVTVTCTTPDATHFNAVSTAAKGASTSTANAAFEKVTIAGVAFWVTREWNTASS